MSETVNLNISDIADAVKVIDHAADQAAFRGWANIRQVIALRDRLELFVTAAVAAESESPAAANEPTIQPTVTN